MSTKSRQKGFLSVLSIVLILIVAFIVVTAAYQFTGDTMSSYNTLKSAQAFAAAQTGVSSGTNAVTSRGYSCAGYNSGVISYTLPNGVSGQYQTTGSTSTAVSALPSGACSNDSCDDDTGSDNSYCGGNYAGRWDNHGNWNYGAHSGNGWKNDTNYQNSCRNSGWYYGWGGHKWGTYWNTGWWSGNTSYDHGNGWGDKGRTGWGSNNSNNSGGITSTASSITLVSTAGFTVPGAIIIDNEIMSYTGISGKTLTGVTRGINGTTAVAHAAGALVIQNQCFLTTTSGIPTLASSDVQRVFRTLLIGDSFGYFINNSYTIPTTTSTGSTYSLSGDATVYNPDVLLNGTGFTGSNIITSGTMNWLTTGGNSPQTKVGNNVNASTGSGTNQKADVQNSTTLFNSGNFFGQYFSQASSTVRANAITNGTFYSSGSNINGLNGQVIWYDGNLVLSSGTIGSTTNPVLLIVSGNLSMSNYSSITGFVYVTGTTTLSGNAKITGALASAGNISLTNNATIKLSLSVLNKTNQISGNMNVMYTANPVLTQETFQ